MTENKSIIDILLKWTHLGQSTQLIWAVAALNLEVRTYYQVCFMLFIISCENTVLPFFLRLVQSKFPLSFQIVIMLICSIQKQHRQPVQETPNTQWEIRSKRSFWHYGNVYVNKHFTMCGLNDNTDEMSISWVKKLERWDTCLWKTAKTYHLFIYCPQIQRHRIWIKPSE